YHCYDFSSIFTLGAQVGIRTDSSVDPMDVPGLVDYYGSAEPDWVEAKVDLTPYVGKSVQIIWWYAAFGDGSDPLDGWLVDDISITGVAGHGTIVISKSLGQGTFTLTGPISSSGIAPLTIITNAPPGPYTVGFSDVAFYHTPADQSGELTNNATLTFTGTY